jgi:hypothetical protein
MQVLLRPISDLYREAHLHKRGTVCRVNEAATFLFTTGFVSEWRTYPGVHVPAPVKNSNRSFVRCIANRKGSLGLGENELEHRI